MAEGDEVIYLYFLVGRAGLMSKLIIPDFFVGGGGGVCGGVDVNGRS